MVFSSYPHDVIEQRLAEGKVASAPGVFLRQIGTEYHAFNFDNLPCDLDGNVEVTAKVEDLAVRKARLAEELKKLQAEEKALKESQSEKQPEEVTPPQS